MAVFGTKDPDHPGVAKVIDQGTVNIAGPVKVFDEGDYPQKYAGLYMRPAETRALFEQKGVVLRRRFPNAQSDASQS